MEILKRRWNKKTIRPTLVGVIVGEPEVVAPLVEAQVEVDVHETESHPLGPLYNIPWRCGAHYVR